MTGTHRHCEEETARRVLWAYFDAFAAGDLDAAVSFLHDDFSFDRGSWPGLAGPEAFRAFYRELWVRGREEIEVRAMAWRPPVMQVELMVQLVMHTDWPEFPGGGVAAGQTLGGVDLLDYHVVDEKIRAITARSEEESSQDRSNA